MDNIEANEDTMRSTSSARRTYSSEVIYLFDTPTPTAQRLAPQLGLGQMKPNFDALYRDWQESHQSEPMDIQREEISVLVQGHGTDPETGLTAHQDESSANHSSTSQLQSAKHNMPKFLAKNIKKLIKTQLKSVPKKQGQQELNDLYLDFVQKNLKYSLKSINNFCFTSPQDKKTEKEAQTVDEKFKEFLKKQLKRPDVIIESKEEWSICVQKCQKKFKDFILNSQADLLKLAQGRGFNTSSKNTGLANYSKRFLDNLREGIRRGKDEKSKRSIQ